MALLIDIILISGRYEAAAEDRSAAEWPPHPARVFCSLVASARSAEDHDALRWLENQPPPCVYAARRALSLRHSAYVVTNSVEKGGGSQFHLGRNNALRSRSSAVPASPLIQLVWPEVEPDPKLVHRLDEMARRVPYLGRSSGLATVSCRFARAAEPSADLVCFEPSPSDGGEHRLRIPYPGHLADLIDQYRHDRPSWEVSRAIGYRRRDDEPVDQDSIEGGKVLIAAQRENQSVYRDVIIMQFEQFRPDGSLAPLFTEALRRAVMSVTPDPLPDALHGHGADGRPHVAFLALPDVGHPHSSGRLLGMAVAVPELPDDERRSIVRSVLGTRRSGDDTRVFPLNVPRLGEVMLTYRPGLVRPWTLNPARWRRGSDRWVSVTPVVLDRYPKRGDIEAEIIRSCLAVGLPEPDHILVSTAPLITGGIRLRPRELPEQVRGRLFRHVSLRFPQRIAGPVLLGAGRYLGIGLLAPPASSEAESGTAG